MAFVKHKPRNSTEQLRNTKNNTGNELLAKLYTNGRQFYRFNAEVSRSTPKEK